MDFGLKGKNALITGGSHGIGRAIALALADEGCNIAICSRTKEHLKATEAELKGKGIKVISVVADVLRVEDIEKVCSGVLKQWGTFHVLINNVGGGGSWGSPIVEETKDDVWTEVYAKNALAAARFTVRSLPVMEKQKWGRIVTITSKYGKEGGGRPWFTMAKSAEIALMKTLALDPRFARAGITFNSVAPGNIMIPETVWEEMKKERPGEFNTLVESLPQGRLGAPEEVASIVVFLCSKQAAHITGACVPVDGGESKSF